MPISSGYDTTEETLGAGNSLSEPLQVPAKESDQAHIYVDDGSGNAVTESYSITLEVKKTLPHDDTTDHVWVPIPVNISSSTARFHPISSHTGGNTDRVFPPSVEARLTLTNDGASNQNYRIIFETVNLAGN